MHPYKNRINCNYGPTNMSFILSSIQLRYDNISKFLVWYNYSFYQLTPGDKKKLKSKIDTITPAHGRI